MSREKGDELERKVSRTLGIRRTTNSGATFGNADLTDREFIVECKVKGKEGFVSCGPEIKKLVAQAEKHGKEWVYIQETKTGTYVVLDWNLFLGLMEKRNGPGTDNKPS